MFITLATYSGEGFEFGGKSYPTLAEYIAAVTEAAKNKAEKLRKEGGLDEAIASIEKSKKTSDKDLKKVNKEVDKNLKQAEKKVSVAKADEDYKKSDRYKTGKKVENVARFIAGDKVGNVVGKVAKGALPSQHNNLKTGLKIAGIAAVIAGLGIASYKIAQHIKDKRRDKINFYYNEVQRLAALRDKRGYLTKDELEDLTRYSKYLAKQAAKEDKSSTMKNVAKVVAMAV